MGWCSATDIFDRMVGIILGADDMRDTTQEELITALVEVLEDMDWDCQYESAYWEHPFVKTVFKKLHPDRYGEVISPFPQQIPQQQTVKAHIVGTEVSKPSEFKIEFKANCPYCGGAGEMRVIRADGQQVLIVCSCGEVDYR